MATNRVENGLPTTGLSRVLALKCVLESLQAVHHRLPRLDSAEGPGLSEHRARHFVRLILGRCLLHAAAYVSVSPGLL